MRLVNFVVERTLNLIQLGVDGQRRKIEFLEKLILQIYIIQRRD